ncbi:Dot/Icm T4SS effector Ceg23 [Legionella longbeachae]|uniref:Dot/Icm T4SS effector Ceg23 n=1 Tax=Legionella longbeachae TaxID=450 RepID=UPI0012480EE2|nr:type IV secretion protein Dot [Legionella longbeachae]QEY50994.1 type IV secretion protein Dot [Legionella longbeachae]
MYDKKDENIKVRVKNAVDVSGSFDNCFFHNYALYLLTNHQALPEDLFNFKSILENSKATQLLHYFPNQKSLNQISLLDTSKDNASNYLFEKTLILGFLFREWFPTQLMEHPELGNEMLEGEHGVFSGFENYKEYRKFMSKEELYTSEFSVLYEANQEFLEYYYNRSLGKIDKNSAFEEYFAHASSNEEAIRNYWNIEGYASYCKYMAQPQVKLSHIEIMAMMKLVNQPLTIYDRSSAAVVDEYRNLNATSPKFEVALHASEGHYFLLKTDETKEDLEEYVQSQRQYKKDRSELLSHSERPVSSLFVRATCPKGHLDDEPFDALIERVSELENLRKVEDKKPVGQKSTTASQNTNHNFLLNLGSSIVGTSAALVTLVGIAILTGQYDPGPSLVEEAVATTVISSVAGLGYSLYNFFTSNAQSNSSKEPEQVSNLSQKQKLN